jgi:ribonuclease R
LSRNLRPAAIDRAQVLRHLREHPGDDKRAIARAFALKGGERVVLKEILRQLAAEGLFAPRRRDDAEPATSRDRAIAGRVVAIDPDSAEAMVEPLEWLRPGRPPRWRLSVRDSQRLERGDRVLVQPGRARGRAALLRQADRLPERVVGVVRASPSGRVLEPVDRRLRASFAIDARGGPPPPLDSIVVADLLPARRLETPRARVREIAGHVDDPRSASLIAIAEQGLPTAFAPDAQREAERLSPIGLGARANLRDRPLVTIDGADARDFDDAVHADADDDPDNPGGFVLTVAIADVAAYVELGSALDREAATRGTSVYFPDRVVPMLPERLSNDLCSLLPSEDRPVIAAELVISRHGRLLSSRFRRAMMRSRARLTYEQAQRAMDGNTAALPEPGLAAPIATLHDAYQALARARERRGALDIDLPERVVELDRLGRVTGIAPRPRFTAHRVIEEFMIAANVAAASILIERGRPCVFRVHDRPTDERLAGLRETASSLGLGLPGAGAMHSRTLAELLRRAAARPDAAQIHEAVLRSQALALYAADNIGHFGLALPRYAHFTSPIRRYADLVVHRCLIAALALGTDGFAPEDAKALAPIAEAISRAERRAQAAERAALDRYIARHLAGRLGDVVAGRVSGSHRVGLFVVLDDTGASGLVPIGDLAAAGWHLTRAGVLARGRQEMRPGAAVQVRIVAADAVTGAVRLALAEADNHVRARPRQAWLR